MKKLIPFLSLVILFSCNPKQKPGTVLVTPSGDTTVTAIDTVIFEDGPAPVSTNAKVHPDKQKKEKFICSFGFKKFNSHKRDWAEAPGGIKGRKPPKGTQPPPPPPPPPPPVVTGNTIYLNFLGKTVSGTMWNTNGDIVCADAGLGQLEIDQILLAVREHYKDYNVTITDDKAIFDSAAIGHKIEVIVTESWEWFGQAGGVAYIGSFTWTDGSPAFVFSSLLGHNAHNIAEAVAHEAGHTLTLRHQSDCSGGVLTNQYSYGKTMGVSYYVPIGLWVTGPNNYCTEQIDQAMLQAAIGLKQ